jgi:hemerythrin-like domain-containing protein
MLNTALTIILDEHRSLAAVIHGLRFLLREMKEKGTEPDFKLLWAMVFYIESFPQKQHHPKENAYLFRKLKARTHEADAVVAELEQQHADGDRHVKELELALGRFEAGAPNGLEEFSAAAENFANEVVRHMALEENVVIPLAKQHLKPEDWAEIADAFGQNGDPRFDHESDQEFRHLFTRIVNLAPPPIGVGPSRAQTRA